MLDNDVRRLKTPYPEAIAVAVPDQTRLATPLGLDLEKPVALGNEIVADLSDVSFGIGWWKAYRDLDRKNRILLSDYLVAAARAIPVNLIEAQVERLEFDHAVEEYRRWFERGVRPGKPFVMKPPQGPYEELTTRRADTHMAGMLRAWGSTLDCLAGCIIGVSGIPTNLVRADSTRTHDSLRKESGNNPLLAKLQADLNQAEAMAGPPGWRDWLLDMRNTMVHRGRRTMIWRAIVNPSGIAGFSLQLPVFPGMTDVEAAVTAGGYIAATFTTPAEEFFDEMGGTVGSYVNYVSDTLSQLWCRRRHDPSLLKQDPKQWKNPTTLISPVPVFRGFQKQPQTIEDVTSIDVGEEANRRLMASGLTKRAVSELEPDPRIWH